MSESGKSDDGVVWLIFLAAIALVAGRIATVASDDGTTAFLSANDRSRWATVASLVEDGTYEIDRVITFADPVHRNRRPFDSIDKVMHVGDDGEFHAYSSKPPLLATMVAAIYWPLHAATGLSLTRYPGYVPRLVLAFFNLPILACFFGCTWLACRRLLNTSWPRIFAATMIGLGTMLTPMAVSLNNHLPAAAATAVVLAIYLGGSRSPVQWFVAGAAAALAVAFELPSLAMFGVWVALFVTSLWMTDSKDFRSGNLEVTAATKSRFWLAATGLSGAAVVAVAFFWTNVAAHGSLRMPYAHRGIGEWIETVDSLDQFDGSKWRREQSDEPGRWRLWSLDGEPSRAIVAVDDHFEIRRWDDWYEYPGSYWRDGRRVGVDLGEPDRGVYAFHMLIGHHGVFSLTPVWCLMPIGLAILFWPTGGGGLWSSDRRLLAIGIAAVTSVCVAFYIARPEIDRNYGGVSVCFRWLLWLAPLWLFACSATLDWISQRRWARHFATAAIVISIFSVSTAIANPWQSPWIMRWIEFLG